jgi:WD40 repeat protein
MVTSLDFSPDARQLAGTCGNAVIVWDIETGAQHCTWTVQGAIMATRIRFLPDGDVVVGSGSSRGNGEVSIHRTLTGKVVRKFTGDYGPVNGIAVSADGQRIASSAKPGGDGAGSVFVRNVATGGESCWVDERFDEVAFTPDGQFVLFAGSDTLHVVDVESGKQVFQQAYGKLECVGVLRGGRHVVAVGASNR